MTYPDPSVYDNGKLRELQNLLNKYYKLTDKLKLKESLQKEWIEERREATESVLKDEFGFDEGELLMAEAQKNKAHKLANTFDLEVDGNA